MDSMFEFCAIVGGVVLVIQFVLTMLGLVHIDMPDGVGMDGMDATHATDMLHATDVTHAGHGMEAGHYGVDIDGSTQTTLPVTFGLLSFRAITAALTLFGLTGMLMESLETSPPLSMVVALAAGLGTLVLVAWVIRTLFQMQSDGTARIGRAINHRANVYVPIPAEGTGKGKIQVNLQGRTMEYEAITAGKTIRSGDTVLITRIVNSDTVEVEPAFDVEEM